MRKSMLQVAILSVLAGPALAESDDPQAEVKETVASLDTVVVQGYREGLRKALSIKREKDEIVEAIGLDEMGRLPAKSMADALKQLPGLTATLDRGNASEIIIRGMGPALSFTTMDGREIASNQADRSVKLEQFPSELMAGAEVFKTQSASMVEGGIAGTVDLKTVNPLDLEKRRISFSTTLAYYPQARSMSRSDEMYPGVDISRERFKNSLSTRVFNSDTPWGTKLSFGYVDQFFDKKLGVALGLGYQDQQSTYKGFAGWGYGSGSINAAGNLTPWGFQSYQGAGREQRNSAMVKLQWRPVEAATITYDYYYAKKSFNEFDTERWVDAWEPDRYTDTVVKDGHVVGGVVVPNSLWNVNANYVADEDVRMNSLNARFDLNTWVVAIDLSKSNAQSASAWYALKNTMLKSPRVTWNTAAGTPVFAVNGADSNDLAAYNTATRTATSPYGRLEDDLGTYRMDASRFVDWGPFAELSLGIRGSDREKGYRQLSWTDRCTGLVSLSSFSEAMKACSASVLSPQGRAPSAGDITSGWRVREDTSSAYIKLGINTEWKGKVIRGNLGVRWVSTHSRSDGINAQSWADASTGWVDVTTYSPVLIRNSYSNYLPSMNLIMDIAEDRKLRFAVARAMSRAPIDDMRSSSNLSRDWSANDEALVGRAGNPLLRPFVATQYDLYHDWYFDTDSLLSAGVFYKKVGTYIGLDTKKETIDGRLATITYPVNGSGGYIRGMELVYQNPFELPDGWGTLGIFANYSYVDSNIKDFQPVNNPVGLNGLTRHNFNGNIWYSKAGYEARLGYSYHTSYTYAVRSDPTGTVKPGNWVNLSLSKKIGNSQIALEVDNITNSRLQSYVQRQTFNWGRYQEFGRRYMLTWSVAY